MACFLVRRKAGATRFGVGAESESSARCDVVLEDAGVVAAAKEV